VKAVGPAPARWSAVFTSDPPLVLVAHGSTDPRFAEVVDAVAAGVRALSPATDVRIGYLEHGPPHVADVVEPTAVVVPLLLTSGYHVRADLPAQAGEVALTAAVGPDQRIAGALAQRLAEAGYDGGPVSLAAAGSADPRALDDVAKAASQLAEVLGAPVTTAFVSAGEPRLADIAPQAVSTYLLAPGLFADKVATCGARVIAEPIGAHPVLAEIVLDRYRSTVQPPGRTAPA
jgi:sirohydrochlorin ferrochelatase